MDYAGPFGIFSFGRRTIRDWSASHPRSPPFQGVGPCQPERWDVVLILFSHYHSAMHPPPFRTDHRLSDWPACRLELNCCRGQTIVPLRLLATQYGDPTFAEILRRLRCSRCRGSPAPVYLCAGPRQHNHGAPADWAIELVQPLARKAPLG